MAGSLEVWPMEMVALVPAFVLLSWFAVVLFVVSLARPLVSATERIATAFDRNFPDAPAR